MFTSKVCLLALTVVVATTSASDIGINPLIVGGQPARQGQFPYAVSLRWKNKHFCGGAIISNRWVATAAYCVYEGPTALPGLIFAYVGAHRRNDGTRHAILRIVRHPQYNRRTKANDIALLNTITNINYVPGRVAACRLPTHDVIQSTNRMQVVMSGWGYTQAPNRPGNNLPATLKYIRGLIPSRTFCQSWQQSVGRRYQPNQVCVGTDQNKGLCDGDIGGPLSDERGDFCLGIASININCNNNHGTDVFTSIFPYLKFIRQVTGMQ